MTLVSKFLGVNSIRAEVMLLKLEKEKLIRFDGSGKECKYGLTDKGKEYLVEKKHF